MTFPRKSWAMPDSNFDGFRSHICQRPPWVDPLNLELGILYRILDTGFPFWFGSIFNVIYVWFKCHLLRWVIYNEWILDVERKRSLLPPSIKPKCEEPLRELTLGTSLCLRQQQADDRAEADKQQMIKKMMTTLKKEKGLVDVPLANKIAVQTLQEWNLDSDFPANKLRYVDMREKGPKGHFIRSFAGQQDTEPRPSKMPNQPVKYENHQGHNCCSTHISWSCNATLQVLQIDTILSAPWLFLILLKSYFSQANDQSVKPSASLRSTKWWALATWLEQYVDRSYFLTWAFNWGKENHGSWMKSESRFCYQKCW